MQNGIYLTLSYVIQIYLGAIVIDRMQMQYEKCSEHPKQYLQLVCVSCPRDALSCPSCIDRNHKEHSMVSLHKFLTEQLPKIYTQEPQYDHLQKWIKQIGTSYQQCFEIMRKLVGQEINDVEAVYAAEIDTLLLESSLICGRSKYTREGVNAIKSKISLEERIPDQKAFESRVQEMCKRMEHVISESTQEVCLRIRGLEEFWGEGKQLLLNSKRGNQFLFSTKMKHRGIAIEMNNSKGKRVVNNVFDNNYHMAVVEPALSPFRNEIRFKVEQSEGNCVWLGICNLEKAVEKKFTNCFKQGDKTYWIWQAGGEEGAQIFSSLLPDSYALPWNVKVGDTIRIRIAYDEKGHRFVQFDKNKAKCYKAKLEDGTFYACVAMGAQDQSVSIVKNIF